MSDSAPDAAPVVAIDGPSASGKGTVAAGVAKALQFHYLDSGALYRVVAYKALQKSVPSDDEPRLAALSGALDVAFRDGRIVLEGADVTDAIRAEAVSAAASQVAVHGPVRQALLVVQHAFRRPPGLVAEGRDMGTVVFPDARVKLFLTASAEERAQRRHKQLMEKGMSANIIDLLREIERRDQRDSTRAVAPLRPADDAILLDTSKLSVAEAIDAVLAICRPRLAAGI